MKKFISGLIVGVILTSLIGAYAVNSIYENPYPIYVNGEQKQIQGYNVDDYSYFKLRDIADAVGGFDVDFHNDTIQISKDGYVYENNSSEHISSLIVDDNIINNLIDYSKRIPDFSEEELSSQEFANNFIFYFYTGIATDREKYDTLYSGFQELFFGWPEDEVKHQYKLLFGKEMPQMTNDYSGRLYIYEDGYYWVYPSNAGEGEFLLADVIETENGGVEITFNCIVYDSNVDEYNVFNKTVYTLYPADNENGYIITSKTTIPL